MKQLIISAAVALLTSFSALAQGGATTIPNPTSIWGGDDIRLSIQGESASFEFTCASATVRSGWRVRRGGVIRANGLYLQGSGMRPRPGTEPRPVAAKFLARITGEVMQVTMTVNGRTQTFELRSGRSSIIRRCM